MRRIIQSAMFVSIFFIGLMALNYYIFFRMEMLLNISSNNVYIFIFISAISFPIATVLEREISHILTRAFYTISAVWVGISFYALFLLLGYEILKLIINIPPVTAGIGIITLTSIMSAYSIVNNIPLEIKELEIFIPNLRRDMKIVQLSDIHMGSIRNSGFLKKIVEKTNELNPDIVLITGDTIDGSAPLHPYMFNATNNLKAPIFLIIGNHEIYEGLENVLEILKTTNINILRDEVVEIQDIQIIGVDYSFERHHLKKVLSQLEIDRSKPSILMYHVPTEIEAANNAGINLQISGHTHKGQLFPFNFLGRLAFPYFNGLYEHNGTKIYVSSGTGTWGPPMRFGSKNEITLIKLKKEHQNR
ncbi:MAG: metallophosphoesterase [Methanobacterium sp.]|uniref:metallophosphoesterase n=1 Tax=Methanobacterium sp. TaxID=2164 RepID=UPI003D65190C|nr:metallophosphoesterase [Methanobacterium sp.]